MSEKNNNKLTQIREKLKEGKALPLYEVEELKEVQRPLSKAIYKNAVGRPKKDDKAKWTDRVQCDICNVTFVRSNRSNHCKTKLHKAYNGMNGKIKKLLLNED